MIGLFFGICAGIAAAILCITVKNKRMKTISVLAAALLLVLCVFTSIEAPNGEKEVYASHPEGSAIVYCTKNGTKQHLSKECSSLKNAQILTYTIIEAEEKGYHEICTVCRKQLP